MEANSRWHTCSKSPRSLSELHYPGLHLNSIHSSSGWQPFCFINSTPALQDDGANRATVLTKTQTRSLHQSAILLSEQSAKDRTAQTQQRQSIVYREEEDSEISTKVTPVSRPEAAGWSAVILAAYGVSAFLLYLVYSQFFVETPETAVFNRALDTVREDFRVSALLGSTIKGYGGEGGRHQRRRISHNSYVDSNQVEHTQVQFFVSGNGKRGVVSADMFKTDGSSQFKDVPYEAGPKTWCVNYSESTFYFQCSLKMRR